MPDIVTRLKRWAIDTDAAPASDLMDEAAALIESLRREVREQRLEIAGLREERRAVLEADRPRVDARLAALEQLAELDEKLGLPRPKQDDASPEWLKKPLWVDPPSGWRYGFPKLYVPEQDGDMIEWMIRNGYPEKLARQGLPCTFTAAGELPDG